MSVDWTEKVVMEVVGSDAFANKFDIRCKNKHKFHDITRFG